MGLNGESKAFPKGIASRSSTKNKIVLNNLYKDFQSPESYKGEGKYTKNYFKSCEKFLKENGYIFINAPKNPANIRKLNQFSKSVAKQYSYFDCDQGRIVYLGSIPGEDQNHPGFVFMLENNYRNLMAQHLLPEI